MIIQKIKFMRLFLVVNVLFTVILRIDAGVNDNYTFEQFKEEYNKTYESVAEEDRRKGIFEKHIGIIEEHNKNSNSTYEMGINRFSDLSDEEMRAIYFGNDNRVQQRQSIQGEYLMTTMKSNHQNSYISTMRKRRRLRGSGEKRKSKIRLSTPLPKHVDWRDKGVVSAVKNQGGCGSCWAFAATETLESHIAIQTGIMFNFSPQQLVSCMPNPNHCGGGGGCTGATVNLAFDYFIANTGGIMEEWMMGYTSFFGDNGVCNVNNYRGAANIESYRTTKRNSYDELVEAVATLGPIAVSVAATPWRHYKEGIFQVDSFEGDNVDINHAVVLVGYGTDEETGLDYWLVRNSWSPFWGEQGYIRLLRMNPSNNKLDDQCGMDTTPQDGDACDDQKPDPIKVCGTSGILYEGVIPVGGHLLKSSSLMGTI